MKKNLQINPFYRNIPIFITLLLILVACNAERRAWQNQDISPDKVRAISAFNTSCISQGMWGGAVVLAGTADSILFRQAWGYTSEDQSTEMPENAVFDLASVTKPVATATAIGLCRDRGWIDLQAPFTRYLSGYQGTLLGKVSVLDLARHLSGFDNSKPYLKESGEEMIEDLLSNDPTGAPGQKYEYACINYILLGLIVEHVSGEPLDQFCKENIFAPLSMDDTHWSPVKDEDNVVKSPFTTRKGIASDTPSRLAGRPVGNAGLFSTADDLAKYCRMMLANGKYKGKSILSKETVQAMRVPADSCSPVALGWFVDSNYNPPSLSCKTLSHTGWTGNSVWIDPANQCFVIVLTNRKGDHDKAIDARTRLAELVLEAFGNIK